MAKETAIREDVDVENANPAEESAPINDQESDETSEQPVSDRDQMMKELAEKRRKQMADTLTDQEDEGEEGDLPAGDQNDTGDELVVLKVNGQEIKKTRQEVDEAGGVAALQKQISGDIKLAQAAEERKRLEQERADLNKVIVENKQLRTELNELRTLITQQDAKGRSHTPEAAEERKKKAQNITDKFFRGDAEELQSAVEMILEAAERPASSPAAAPPVNEEAIAQRVAKEIEFKQDRAKAVNWFETENQDLNTPGRRRIVNDRTKELIATHPNWSPIRVMEEAVKVAREDLGIPKPAPHQKNPDPLEEKRNRKREVVDRLPQANQRRSAPITGSQPKTKAQIFDEIQAKRSHS